MRSYSVYCVLQQGAMVLGEWGTGAQTLAGAVWDPVYLPHSPLCEKTEL